MSSTVAVSAAVSAVVSVLVGTLLKWGQRLLAAVRKKLAPDHGPISEGGDSSGGSSSTNKVRVTVCCAPSRTRRSAQVNPDRAIGLIRSQFGDLFPDPPKFSAPGHGVRFERPDGVIDGYAWARAGGRIDLCLSIATTPELTFAAVEVARTILKVRAAVRSAEYRAAYGRPRLGFRERFDWIVTVTPTVQAGHGSKSWTSVTFPEQPPPRAGSEQNAFCPPGGYAAQDLRSWPAGRSDARLLSVALSDFLFQNGYHDVGPAVEEIVAATGTP